MIIEYKVLDELIAFRKQGDKKFVYMQKVERSVDMRLFEGVALGVELAGAELQEFVEVE